MCNNYFDMKYCFYSSLLIVLHLNFVHFLPELSNPWTKSYLTNILIMIASRRLLRPTAFYMEGLTLTSMAGVVEQWTTGAIGVNSLRIIWKNKVEREKCRKSPNHDTMVLIIKVTKYEEETAWLKHKLKWRHWRKMCETNYI